MGSCCTKELPKNSANVVLGAQFGDEGKGKLVDMLACEADVACRFQGGSNAGHTVVVDVTTYDFHLLPSAVINRRCTSVMGNGMVIHLPSLFAEIRKCESKGLQGIMTRLLISDRAHLVFDFHQAVDGLLETEKGSHSLGTTKRGIGPAYASKSSRIGVRVSDLVGDFEEFTRKFNQLVASEKKMFPQLDVRVEEELKRYREYADEIRDIVTDTSAFVNREINLGKHILIEGANATMLDIDFGTYPYVTSSNTSIGGVCTGLGIPPTKIDKVYGVVKAYMTRVGDGPFPTELSLKNKVGAHLQSVGHEVGVTTGRIRRCGWLDLVVIHYTHRINDYSAIALTKLDVLDELEELKICIGYKLDGQQLSGYPANIDDLKNVEVDYYVLPGWKVSTKDIREWDRLPKNAQKYVTFIESQIKVKIQWVGVGPARDAVIVVPDHKI